MALLPQQTLRRWTADRLDRELAFARSARDENHPENMGWLAALEAEAKRREALRTPAEETR